MKHRNTSIHEEADFAEKCNRLADVLKNIFPNIEIQANYDGANKHATTLGDHVHTGSNSVLVAPIKVGTGATVGAGSTVVREVPAGKLTVARAKQLTLDGWKRPVKKKP